MGWVALVTVPHHRRRILNNVPHVLEVLAERSQNDLIDLAQDYDRSEQVGASPWLRERTWNVLRRLDDVASLRIAAANPQLSDDALIYLGQHHSSRVAYAAYAHPRYPLSQLTSLYDRLHHRDCSSDDVADALAQAQARSGEACDLYTRAVAHPNLPPTARTALVERGELAVLNNPGTTHDQALTLMRTDASYGGWLLHPNADPAWCNTYVENLLNTAPRGSLTAQADVTEACSSPHLSADLVTALYKAHLNAVTDASLLAHPHISLDLLVDACANAGVGGRLSALRSLLEVAAQPTERGAHVRAYLSAQYLPTFHAATPSRFTFAAHAATLVEADILLALGYHFTGTIAELIQVSCGITHP